MWFFEEDEGEALASSDRDFDLSAASLSVPLSLTRATETALGRDNSGRWVAFPANTPRSWYDPKTLATRYTLIEPQRTQLVYHTRQPTLTALQSTSPFDASVQTPFGLGAVHFIPNTTSINHGWNLFFGTASHAALMPDNTTAALTAVLRPSGVFKGITFFLLNKNNVYSSARFLLEGDGSIVESTGITSAEITRDTDDFYMLTVVNNFQSGTTTSSFNAGFVNAAGTRTFPGDGTSGYYLAYIGAEIGNEATSPIINTGITTVTRPADVLVSTADWVSGGGKTFGLTYAPLAKSPATILSISGTDLMELRNGPGTVTFSASVGGQQSALINAAAPAAGIPRTVVVTVSAGSALMAQDGVLVGADNTGTTVASNVSSIRFGDNVGGTNGGPVLLKQMKFWSEALPQDAVLSYSGDLTQEFEDDNKPSISVQPIMTVTASASVASLLVVMAGEPVGTTVSYSTVNGTAIAGTDYVGATGLLQIPVGQTSAIITVGLMPRGDAADKIFKIILGSATGATITNGVCEILLLRDIPEGTAATTKAEFAATLPSTFTLTRASPAWARNSSGLWTQVGIDGYRMHHVSPGNAGLLIEAAASEQQLFDSVTPGFTATGGAMILSVGEVTPTGTRQVQFRETTETGQHKLSLVLTSSNSQTSGGAFTTSLMIRPIQGQYYAMTIRGTDNVTKSLFLNLSGVGTVNPGSVDVVASVERDPFQTSWYTVFLGRPQSDNSGVQALIEISTATSDGTIVMTGVSGRGFDICHVQVEPGIGASSPIIVTGQSAKTVRAADVLKAAGTWYQRQSYSLGVRFRRLRDMPTVQRLWMAKDIAKAINGVVVKSGQISYDLVGVVPLLFTEFVSTGSQTVWQLPDSGTDGAPYSLIVAIDGIVQSSNAYTLTGNTLTLSEAPPSAASIDVRGVPYASVLIESLGTGSKTAWTLPNNYAAGAGTAMVVIDGVVQPPSSYTISAGQLNFSEALPLAALLSVRGIGMAASSIEFVANGIDAFWTLPISVAGPTTLLVFIDGILQHIDSYTTSTTQLILSQAPPANALIDVRIIGS